MFFKAIADFRPDVIVLTGVHLLESQVSKNKKYFYKKFRRNLFVKKNFGSLSDRLCKLIPSFLSICTSEAWAMYRLSKKFYSGLFLLKNHKIIILGNPLCWFVGLERTGTILFRKSWKWPLWKSVSDKCRNNSRA